MSCREGGREEAMDGRREGVKEGGRKGEREVGRDEEGGREQGDDLTRFNKI